MNEIIARKLGCTIEEVVVFKRSIEAKLGYTIEELKIKMDIRREKYGNYESDGPSLFPYTLTDDECDFLGEYLDELNRRKIIDV